MRPKAPTSSFTWTAPKFGQDFLREAYRELKRVNWPTRKQALRLTLVVLSISILVGLYVGLLDLSFTKLMTLILTL